MVTTTLSQFDIAKLRQIVATALSLPNELVFSGQKQDLNALKMFVTVDLAYSHEIGTSYREFDGDNETETITTACQSVVSISAYGKNAMALMLKLRTLLQSSSCLDAFRAENWGLLSCSDVRNLSATVAYDYEERGQMDLTITHEHSVIALLFRTQAVDIHPNSQSISINKETKR
ncbi:phage neck terminator protein [Lonepinella koalarum]